MKKYIPPLKRIITFFLLLLFISISAYSQNDRDARIFYQDGSNALAEDNPYTAIEFFRTALTINPSFVDARLGMAEALFQLTEYD
ncbi:MAG: tetratricopeptide repeat protein, partial [Spirochaetaceae bacterium]|nr:tetratricopeptide repeat protein [Spirochaetaceae bacterium]